MKKDNIRCVVKRVGEEPTYSVLANKLDAFQAAVNGYIECVYFPNNVIMLVNEESLLRGDCRFNCRVGGYQYFGNIVFVGNGGEEFTDLPVDIEKIKEWIS